MNKELITIDIKDVKIQKLIRSDMGDLESLQESISSIGLLHPIIIDKNNMLISGSRRLQAVKNTGNSQIQALRVQFNANSMDALNIQADENLCRLDLSAEDIERHISSKVKTGSRSAPFKKAIDWFGKLFSRSEIQ